MSNQFSSLIGLYHRLDVFMDSLQYGLNLLEHLFSRQFLVGSPKESNIEASIRGLKQIFLQAISLTNLPFDTISLDRSLEIAL